MSAELLDNAVIELYASDTNEIVSTVEADDKTAMQLYAMAKDLLAHDPLATYAMVKCHGRTMTLTKQK